MKRLVQRAGSDAARHRGDEQRSQLGQGPLGGRRRPGLQLRRTPTQIDDYHAQFPKQFTMGTEVASTVSTRGIYANDAAKGYVSAYDRNFPAWASTAEEWWSTYDARPWVAGGFVWTGFDYRGEPTPYNWPCISSHFGILDMCGFPKDLFYYYQAWWTGKPVLHLFPHWNWAGKEGQEIEVWCFTNLRSRRAVRERHERRRAGREEELARRVEGAVRAGSDRGARDRRPAQPPLVDRRETTGAPAKIVLEPDRAQHRRRRRGSVGRRGADRRRAGPGRADGRSMT